jgi:hypothetical protein
VVLIEGLNGPEKQRRLAGDKGRAARMGGARGVGDEMQGGSVGAR